LKANGFPELTDVRYEPIGFIAVVVPASSQCQEVQMQKNCSTPNFAKLFLVLVALLFSRTGWSQKEPVRAEGTPPPPGLVITFEKQTIREDEEIPIHIVLSNPSDKPLSDVTLALCALW
jgi:hypothetical protein